MAEVIAKAERSCECEHCQNACRKNPGWMIPAEAQKAMDAGFSGRLMLDWFEPDPEIGNEDRIWVLAPASVGYGGREARDFTIFDYITSSAVKGRCSFLTCDGKCEIHASGFKPHQCRIVMACEDVEFNAPSHEASNFSVARLWDTDEGRNAVSRWREENV